MALPILSCECKTFLFFFSTGLHLCFSGSVKLPGLWLDTAALSLSQRQQHPTGRQYPDSPAALPETRLRCFEICCITHQFCLTERCARISVMHWEDATEESNPCLGCCERRALLIELREPIRHTLLCQKNWRLKRAKWKQTQQKPFVLMWYYQHQMAEKEARLKRELNIRSSILVLFWDYRCCTCC